MNQNIINTLESICKHYEVKFMEMVNINTFGSFHFDPLLSNLSKAVEDFEKLKQKAQQNDAEAQRGLGFCYEQGLSDEWFEDVKQYIEIETLFLQRIEQCGDLQELLEEREKQRKNIKDRCRELNIEEKFDTENFLFLASSDPETYFIRASKSSLPIRSQWNLYKELEPLALQIDSLSKKIEPLQNSLISDELHEKLKTCKDLLFSEKTYMSKITVAPELAFKWYEQAVLNDDKYACADLGFCYLRGFGVPVDEQKAISLLTEAAEAGNCMALKLLGDCYADGIVLDEDMLKAQDCWNKAPVSEKLSTPAIYFLFKNLFIDDGFNEDKYVESQYKSDYEYEDWLEEIVNFYLKNGCFSEVVDNNSRYWNDVIDNTSSSNYQSEHAEEVLFGNIAPKKYKANTSDIKVWLALFSAGASYLGIPAKLEHGKGTQGIEKNQNKALEIWHTLAENDNPIACFRLGMHYQYHDVEKSKDYLAKSAKKNFYPANFVLSLFYLKSSESKVNLELSLEHIEKVISSNEIVSRIAKPNSPYSACYDEFDNYVFGNYSWDIIEYVRLCGLLFTKKRSDGLEQAQKIISNIVDYYSISNAKRLNKVFWDEMDVLGKEREIYVDDPLMLLLCEFAFDNQINLKSKKRKSPGDPDLVVKIKHQKIKFGNNTLDHVFEAFAMDLTGATTNRFSLLYQNETVFNALIKWIYQEHYDPLLLGLLNFYKAYDFINYKCDKSSQNIGFALNWFQAYDLHNIDFSSEHDVLQIMLSNYCQALINEDCNPNDAQQILASLPKSLPDISHISAIELNSAQAHLITLLKFKRLELKERIKLRVKAEEAKAEAARANGLKTSLEKLVQRTSHTLANTIFPNTLYQVAERLKDKVELRRDVLLLLDAYHAEVSIRHENELLQQRYTTDSPEPLRQIMRGDRRNLPNIEARSIEELVNYALSRVIARFLNAHSAKFEPIRQQIIGNKELTLDELRQDFEEAMFFQEPPMTAQAWCQKHLRPVELVYRNALWQEIGLKREGLAEALLYGHFAEVLFNAFKYADHTSVDFIQVEFDAVYQNDVYYLTLTWRNPIPTERSSSMGNSQGLDAIKEDLQQLNGQHETSPTLHSWQDNGYFYLRLSYQADLLWLQPMPSVVDAASFLIKD